MPRTDTRIFNLYLSGEHREILENTAKEDRRTFRAVIELALEALAAQKATAE